MARAVVGSAIDWRSAVPEPDSRKHFCRTGDASWHEVVGTGAAWHLKQDGEPIGNYPSKEAAFEAAVAAALPVLRDGYEVQISVPGRRIES
jgi:hypothetical protein